MARPLRMERPGGWYHVTSRGNERRAIYRQDRDREHFCQLLGEMTTRFGLRVHAYVLMGNHYHLLVELIEAKLSRAIQWLNVSYSVWFNRKYQRSGHLFQGRFKSVVVAPEEWGLELSRYVHLNPVRVGALGLGKSDRAGQRQGGSRAPERAEVRQRLELLRGYRWSSYRAYLGLVKEPEWLECQSVLKLGGGRKAQRREHYREYVEQAVREGLARSPWESLREQVVLGGARFLEEVKEQLVGDEREQRAVSRLGAVRPELEAVIACVEKERGEKWESFRDRHGDRGRDLVLYFGRRGCGLKLDELAQRVGLKEYASVAMALKRYEVWMRGQAAERKRVERIARLLNIKM